MLQYGLFLKKSTILNNLNNFLGEIEEFLILNNLNNFLGEIEE